jgi:hypothetical protein
MFLLPPRPDEIWGIPNLLPNVCLKLFGDKVAQALSYTRPTVSWSGVYLFTGITRVLPQLSSDYGMLKRQF